MLICSSCGETKSETEFHKNLSIKVRGYSWYCKTCMKIKYDSNRSNDYKSRKRERDRKKRRIMLHYSNNTLTCKCCGEHRIEFLTIDHINNDGAAHRREIGRTPQNLYKWIEDNNYPEGFQVLCFNCNCAKEYSGYCPHEEEQMIQDQIDKYDLPLFANLMEA